VESDLILKAYRHGLFPMADPKGTGEIGWYCADPRGVIPLDDRFHVPESLTRVVRSERFEIRSDTDFEGVMRSCAAPRPKEKMTWISEEMIGAYVQLHREGWGHSVEAWRADEGGRMRMVGGLYGIAIGGVFFGESMFSRADQGGRDASKVCLVALVMHLRSRGYALLDAQAVNPHLKQFGCMAVPMQTFQAMLHEALALEGRVNWGTFTTRP